MEPSLRVADQTIADETAALRRLARALVHDRAAADDLVQNTWLAALRRPPSAARPLRPWLARVLRNAAVSTDRSAGRARAREAAAAGASSAEPFDAIDVARQLLEEVARLPGSDRELIAMVYWEGLSSAECAERVGRPASTVRTQLQRALTRLRRRLDEERGGRAAWMAALVPLAGARRSGPTALMVGLGLVGLASFGLVALAPNGCTADLATTAAPASDLALRETPADAAVPASPRAEWSAVAPKAAPLAPKKGKAPAKAEAEAEGLAHPKIVFFGAFREVFTSLEECREGDGVASVRFQVEAVFDGEDPPFVEVVHFEEPNNVADSEIECLRQTLLAMDMVAPSPAFGPFRYNPTAVFHFDAEGKLRSEGINRGPTMHLFTATKTGADLTEAVAACSSTEAAVELELTFDPGTYALTAIVPTDETDVAKCVQNAVRELVRPTRRFEPIHPEDATLRCAFWVGKPSDYKCRRTGPDGNYVQDL